MWHTDETFRHLLLTLAESDPPDLSVLPALADWLAEHEDEERAEKVRGLSVHETRIGGEFFWVVCNDAGGTPAKAVCSIGLVAVKEAARRILSLFPEEPRWQDICRRDDGIFITKADDCLMPAMAQDNLKLSRAIAEALRTKNGWQFTCNVEGPIWPNPPTAAEPDEESLILNGDPTAPKPGGVIHAGKRRGPRKHQGR